MNYSYKKEIDMSFDQAVSRVKEELSKEGFGVLTEVDVKSTMKQKLGIDYDNYIILGVCNPTLAHRALSVEKEVGLFLPCNVIVYEDNGSIFVSVISPVEMMRSVGSDTLNEVAQEAQEKLENAINAL